MEILHATCVFNAEEELNALTHEMENTYKDRENVKVFGGRSCNTEEPIKSVHDCEVLAGRASNEDDVMDGGTSLLSYCKGLSNGLAIIGNEVPHVREVAHWDALFVVLPLMRRECPNWSAMTGRCCG